MVSFERNQILGAYDVDDDLTLRLIVGKEHPWVSIDNRMTGKKKSVRMLFIENGKDLQIRNGKGGTKLYSHGDIMEALQNICSQALDIPQIRRRYVEVLQVVLTKIFEPKYVGKEPDFLMLQEEKKQALWLGCFTDASSTGVMKPCFPVSQKEEALMDTLFDEEIAPFGRGFALRVGERPSDVLKRNAVAKKLITLAPERWLNPLSIGLAAVFFGMTEWSMDDTFPFLKQMWSSLLDPPHIRNHNTEEELREAFRGFINIMSRYIKLYHVLPHLQYDEVMDAEDLLKEEGFNRRERFEESPAVLGNQTYQVERLIKEDGSTALILASKGLQAQPDEVIRIKPHVYEECLSSDSCGSVEDSRFTAIQLFLSIRISRWLDFARRIMGPSILRG